MSPKPLSETPVPVEPFILIQYDDEVIAKAISKEKILWILYGPDGEREWKAK